MAEHIPFNEQQFPDASALLLAADAELRDLQAVTLYAGETEAVRIEAGQALSRLFIDLPDLLEANVADATTITPLMRSVTNNHRLSAQATAPRPYPYTNLFVAPKRGNAPGESVFVKLTTGKPLFD